MQVIPSLSSGGAEQGCLDVAAAVAATGGRSIIASAGGRRVPEAMRRGVEHMTVPLNTKNPGAIWQNVKKLREVIEGNAIDIVHVRSRAPAWSARQACKTTNAILMSTVHAPYQVQNPLKRFYNSIMVKGERVIAISEWVREYVLREYLVDPNKVCTVPRGIPLEIFHPTSVSAERIIQLSEQWRLPDNAGILLLPGRLTRWKGHHVVIEAMARMKRRDVFAVFAGDPEGKERYRKELEDKIQEKGLGGQIRITGNCMDMPAAYMLAGAVIAPSIEPEGFGRVAVEAQAMGRPVIAADHGGARETIKRGETGWLVPPGDPDTTARAIEEALALTPHQRAILATRAMAHVAQNFTRENMCEQTLDIYAELLQSRYAENNLIQRAA